MRQHIHRMWASFKTLFCLHTLNCNSSPLPPLICEDTRSLSTADWTRGGHVAPAQLVQHCSEGMEWNGELIVWLCRLSWSSSMVWIGSAQREAVCREGQRAERGRVQREAACRHVGTSKGVAKAWPGRAGERGPCSEKPARSGMVSWMDTLICLALEFLLYTPKSYPPLITKALNIYKINPQPWCCLSLLCSICLFL